MNVIPLWRRDAERLQRLFAIGPSGLCCWGALTYERAEPVAIARIVEALDLPLIVCRTATGGTQVYLFLAKWTPMTMVYSALLEMVRTLGLPPETEISPPPWGQGPVVWMPYFGGDRGNNPAMRGDGQRMKLAKFLTLAEHFAETTHIIDVADMGPGATLELVEQWAEMWGGPGTNTIARKALR